MKKINFGIIGFGNIGKRHKQRIDENEYANVIAICDIKEDELGEINEKSIFRTTNYKELLEIPEIDVVTIATPNGYHAQMSIDAMNAGKNVVCEKPMALTSADANNMISVSQQSQKELFIVKQNRFNPPVNKVRELLQNGQLGKPYFVSVNCFWNRNEDYYLNSDWKGKLFLDGGTLFTQFIHFIDIVYNLLGDFNSVFAKSRNYNHPYIEFEDTGVMLFELTNGVLGSLDFTICSYDKNLEGSITIFTEKGTVKIGGQYLNTIEYHNIKDVDSIKLEKGNKPNDYGTYKGSMSNHDHVIANVVNTLNGVDMVATTAFEGMKTIKIVEAAYQSIRTGLEVKIHN